MASILDEGLLVQEARLSQGRPSGHLDAALEAIHRRCEAASLVAKRATAEFGDRVVFREIDTSTRDAVAEWGVADAVLVDGKNLQKGPPPSYNKIRTVIAKRVR